MSARRTMLASLKTCAPGHSRPGSRFTPQQIIEISYTVGTYYSTGFLTEALKIQLETDGRLTVPGEC
jgi:hypothetical protein